MKELFATIVFPGLGHLLAGRRLKGAVLAVSFSVTVQALLATGVVWADEFRWSRPGLWALAGAIWMYALVSVVREVLVGRDPGRQKQKDALLAQGMKEMLHGELETAQRTFRTVLGMDDRDVEGWLYLGRTCQMMGQAQRARRCYGAVRRLDVSGKWAWEQEQAWAESHRTSS